MYTIHLEKMMFFAHHGLHDEEKIAGTHFEISIDIDINSHAVEKLEDSVDYAMVYEIVKSNMQAPIALLEKLAAQIADAIYAYDKKVSKINIRINKLQAPIAHFSGIVGVSFCKSY